MLATFVCTVSTQFQASFVDVDLFDESKVLGRTKGNTYGKGFTKDVSKISYDSPSLLLF